MDLTRLSWLAGLYEGEGSCSAIVMSETSVSLHLRIRMTDLDVLQTALAVAGTGSINGPYRRGKAHWKPQWDLAIQSNEQVYALLVAMWPLLHERRRAQIRRAIQSWLAAHHARPTIEDRFWAKVVKSEDPHGCWIWTGAHNSSGQLGQFTISLGNIVHAHRFAWELLRGPIEIKNDHLLSKCKTPFCVRPDHHRLSSQECPKGHSLTADNIKIRLDRQTRLTVCRACANDRSAASKKRARANGG